MKSRKHTIITSILICITVILSIPIIILSIKSESSVRKKNEEINKSKICGSLNSIKVGFSVATYQEERWLIDRDIFVSKCNELGAEVIVQSANGDEERQYEQCEKLINKNVDVLVIISQNSDKSAAIASKAKAKGIPVVAYDRLIRNCEVDAFVTYDNIKIGELQAEYLIKKVPKGNYVLLEGDEADYNSLQIKQGQMNILTPFIRNCDIHIIENKWVKDWNPSEARRAILEVDKSINAVLAANDGIAGGATQALAEKKLAGKVVISGQDADLAGCQRIVEGIQTMTVYTPIKAEAEGCAEIAIKIAKGETFDNNSFVDNGKCFIPTLLLKPIPVDKDNIINTVIKDGYQKMQDVYKHIPEDKWPAQ